MSQSGKPQSYHQRMQRDRVTQLRALTRELPTPCLDFLLSIEAQTTILTRMAYAYDLRIFFQYLSTEVRAFSGKDVTEFDDGDLSRVAKLDIERYSAYLTLYYRNESGTDGAVISREIENHEQGKMRKLASLRSFFKYLYASGRVPGNVAELVALPKQHQKAIIRLDIDEVARMLDLAETGEALSPREQAFHQRTRKRDLAMLSLFLGTGIRVSECVGINSRDINFAENAFVVTRKGGEESMLFFSEEVAEALQDYALQREAIETLPGHEEAFFLSLQRRRITQRAVENLVKKYARLAAPLKRKISPHKLRSTFGTNLYRATGDIYMVADVLGHSDVNTTRKHYAAIPEDNRRIAARKTVLREEKQREEGPT